MTPFHDYSYYLQVAERKIKRLDERCLHKDFEGADQDVKDALRALSGLLVWIEDVQQKP
jgi:hypothetical protein